MRDRRRDLDLAGARAGGPGARASAGFARWWVQVLGGPPAGRRADRGLLGLPPAVEGRVSKARPPLLRAARA